MLVGVLGIVNTLSMSVLERTREIGVLRALGASRWRMRRAMADESLLISVAGTIAGIGAGVLVGVVWIVAMRESTFPGLSLHLPLNLVLAIAVLGVVVGVLAAILPARRAAKLDPLSRRCATSDAAPLRENPERDPHGAPMNPHSRETTMGSMLAYQLTAWQQPPELRDVPVPEPGPGEVLVKVAGAGACHSDLHLMEWPEGQMPFDLPFTLGHENTGWIEELGAGVTGFTEGDAVAVYGPWGCGHCRACRLSREDYCEHQAEIGAFGGGLGLDGGMAEYMLVPSSRLLLPLGDLDPHDAAPLTDAGLTPYHGIKRSLHLLVPGSTAVVIGCGGLGHMAVEMLSALSPARIVAVDTSADKLALAGEIGADETFLPGEHTAGAIRALTGGRGVELVLDIVGSDETLDLARQVVGFESHLTVLGLAGGKIDYDWAALPFESQLTTTYWGTAVELMEVIELARTGRIGAHVERFPLEQVDEAYARLRAGTLDGRAVICPNG